MQPHVRAAVAAVALAHSTGEKVSSVYASGVGYLNIDATVEDGRVGAYDYSNGCHFDGDIPSLYHYGIGSHVDFEPQESGKYGGYDYGAGCHYEVTVSGRSAEVYDYGAGGHFHFST